MVKMSISGIGASLYDVKVLDVSKILLVTDSGAGPPLARLYLMPKSFLGPSQITASSASVSPSVWQVEGLTTGVVACSKQNTTSRLAEANDMTCGGSGKNSILADQKLLDTVCRTDFGNQLNDLGIPVPAITTNDEERA
jgi:hypothetical protein